MNRGVSERLMKQLLAPLLIVATLSGCVGSAEPADIAVASYPAAFLAEFLAGDDLVLVDLARGGALHDFEPSARDLNQLRASTHLILWDEALESWAHQAEHSLGNSAPKVVEVTALPAGEQTIALDDDHEGHSDGGDAADEHGHDELEYDPHTWNDPLAMQASLHVLADFLTAAYPDNATAIQARADVLDARLTALHESFGLGLSECARNTVVTNHEAHNYLAKRYGFELFTLHSITPGSEPSPQVIQDAIEMIDELGLPSIFIEEGTDAGALRAIQDETGVEVRILNTLESRPMEGDYIDAQRHNLQELRFAMGCA